LSSTPLSFLRGPPGFAVDDVFQYPFLGNEFACHHPKEGSRWRISGFASVFFDRVSGESAELLIPVVMWKDGTVKAVHPLQGKFLWQTELGSGLGDDDRRELPSLLPTDGTGPVAITSKAAFVSDAEGVVRLSRKGQVVWRAKVDGKVLRIVTADAVLIVESDQVRLGLEPETGRQLWQTPVAAQEQAAARTASAGRRGPPVVLGVGAVMSRTRQRTGSPGTVPVKLLAVNGQHAYTTNGIFRTTDGESVLRLDGSAVRHWFFTERTVSAQKGRLFLSWSAAALDPAQITDRLKQKEVTGADLLVRQLLVSPEDQGLRVELARTLIGNRQTEAAIEVLAEGLETVSTDENSQASVRLFNSVCTDVARG